MPIDRNVGKIKKSRVLFYYACSSYGHTMNNAVQESAKETTFIVVDDVMQIEYIGMMERHLTMYEF